MDMFVAARTLTFPILRLVIIKRASCEERIAAAGARFH
jgi:hypothetical protein